MRVKTRSNEIKFVQKNSTALDFAFKLHKDIGFGFKYAIINDSKTKSPPYTKLLEGDKVEIVVEKDGETIKNNAELKWFAYINTDLAKKYLIKAMELSTGEEDTLRLLYNGISSHEIAAKLDICFQTVYLRRKRMQKKYLQII